MHAQAAAQPLQLWPLHAGSSTMDMHACCNLYAAYRAQTPHCWHAAVHEDDCMAAICSTALLMFTTAAHMSARAFCNHAPLQGGTTWAPGCWHFLAVAVAVVAAIGAGAVAAAVVAVACVAVAETGGVQSSGCSACACCSCSTRGASRSRRGSRCRSSTARSSSSSRTGSGRTARDQPTSDNVMVLVVVVTEAVCVCGGSCRWRGLSIGSFGTRLLFRLEPWRCWKQERQQILEREGAGCLGACVARTKRLHSSPSCGTCQHFAVASVVMPHHLRNSRRAEGFQQCQTLARLHQACLSFVAATSSLKLLTEQSQDAFHDLVTCRLT